MVDRQKLKTHFVTADAFGAAVDAVVTQRLEAQFPRVALLSGGEVLCEPLAVGAFPLSDVASLADPPGTPSLGAAVCAA
jgi:hypothetical protein